MLFKRKKKTTKTDSNYILTGFKQTVPHTRNFRGCKRIKLATYMFEPAYEGIEAIGDKPIDTVSFVSAKADDAKLIEVYADSHRIGTIWEYSWEDYYKIICAGKVEKAHVMINNKDDVYLFIKYEQ